MKSNRERNKSGVCAAEHGLQSRSSGCHPPTSSPAVDPFRTTFEVRKIDTFNHLPLRERHLVTHSKRHPENELAFRARDPTVFSEAKRFSRWEVARVRGG